MDQLPFANDYFEHVLSWNTIYHGNHDILIHTVNEIKRVLKPGGTFHGTMLPQRRIPWRPEKTQVQPGLSDQK